MTVTTSRRQPSYRKSVDLPAPLYERLLPLLAQGHTTITAAIREALLEWAERREQ